MEDKEKVKVLLEKFREVHKFQGEASEALRCKTINPDFFGDSKRLDDDIRHSLTMIAEICDHVGELG